MNKLLSDLDFSKAKVLIAGDMMLDRYYYGSVSRISPEAPVPVINVKSEIYTKTQIEDRFGKREVFYRGKISKPIIVNSDLNHIHLLLLFCR